MMGTISRVGAFPESAGPVVSYGGDGIALEGNHIPA